MANIMVQDAVIRNLAIIGEVVKNISMDFRLKHQHLPWPQIAGMRDVLVHNYFGVKLETIWEVIDNRLPSLRKAIENILQEKDHQPE